MPDRGRTIFLKTMQAGTQIDATSFQCRGEALCEGRRHKRARLAKQQELWIGRRRQSLARRYNYSPDILGFAHDRQFAWQSEYRTTTFWSRERHWPRVFKKEA